MRVTPHFEIMTKVPPSLLPAITINRDINYKDQHLFLRSSTFHHAFLTCIRESALHWDISIAIPPKPLKRKCVKDILLKDPVHTTGV
jgi:hypothetical protein